MAASASDIARLRRMVNEPSTDTYSDNTLAEYIQRYPCIDDQGIRPFYFNYLTTPPTRAESLGWIPTYDLNRAAADIWEEKAAILSQDYDFQADGADYSRSQAYEQAMKQARHFRARGRPGTITLDPEPRPTDTRDLVWIGNLREPEDY